MDVRKFLIIIAFLGMQQSYSEVPSISGGNKVVDSMANTGMEIDHWFSGAGPKIKHAFECKGSGAQKIDCEVLTPIAVLLTTYFITYFVLKKVMIWRINRATNLTSDILLSPDAKRQMINRIKDEYKGPFDSLYRAIMSKWNRIGKQKNSPRGKPSEVRLGNLSKFALKKMLEKAKSLMELAKKLFNCEG